MWPFDRGEREQARINAELEPDRRAFSAYLKELRSNIEATDPTPPDHQTTWRVLSVDGEDTGDGYTLTVRLGQRSPQTRTRTPSASLIPVEAHVTLNRWLHTDG